MKERRGKEQRIVWKGVNKEVNNRGKLRREEKGEEKKSIEGEENRREYYIFLYVLTW